MCLGCSSSTRTGTSCPTGPVPSFAVIRKMTPMTPIISDLVARLGQPGREKGPGIWVYTTVQGAATLNKGDDDPLKKIGQFATDELARKACEDHFKKAMRAMLNLGTKLPDVRYA